MALVNLVITTLSQIDDIIVDAALSETHNSDVEVTDHEVEQGSNISDHARVKPQTITLDCLVSNTPLNREQTLRATGEQSDPKGAPGYAEDVFARLEKLRDDTRLITVITSLKTYDNMMLTSLSVPRSVQTGDALRFTANFKQVRLVKNQTTEVKITKTTQGQKKKNLGKTAPDPLSADGATKAKEKTQLLEGAVWLGAAAP